MNFLEYIDITKNEEIVYKGLLKHPDTNASKLSRILRLDKSSTYRAVDGLLTKNLIIQSTSHDEVIYKSVSPERLQELHDAKSKDLDKKKNNLNQYIEDLIKYSSQYNRGTKLKVEYGINAHIEAMERSLEIKRGETILEKWHMNNPIFNDTEYNDYINNYIKRRLKKKINTQFLVDSNFDNSNSEIMQSTEDLLKEVRKNPEDADDKNSFRIFENQIEIVSFDKQNNYIVISLEDPFITQMFRNFFKFIWNRSEPI